MKNLNYKIIVLSCSLTAVLLFGGWFLMQYLNTERPIQDWIEERDGIEMISLENGQDSLRVNVRFVDHEVFGQDYLAFHEYLKKTAGAKEVHIHIAPEQGENHPFWLEQSFSFVELIRHEQFTQLKGHIEKLEQDGLIVSGNAMMNSDLVFIYLLLPEDQSEENEVYVTLKLHEPQGREA